MNQHTTQHPDALLKLIEQVRKCHYPQPHQPKKGRPRKYSELSFLLLAVTAVVLRTFKERELRRLLALDEGLRSALGFEHVPHRRTIGRRLQALVPAAEAQIAKTGQQIVEEMKTRQPHTSAIDGRMYAAQGPRWHKRDRQRGRIPPGLRNVDCESSWFKSGYRGWVQGYRLVMQCLVFPTPVPLTAFWRKNSEGEATITAQALRDERLPVTAVLLGDETFGGGKLVAAYRRQGGWLLTPQQLPEERRSWKDDLYAYRKETVELLFQRVIQSCELAECPAKGWARSGAFILASVWLYQTLFLWNYRSKRKAPHVKEQIDLARWRIAA